MTRFLSAMAIAGTALLGLASAALAASPVVATTSFNNWTMNTAFVSVQARAFKPVVLGNASFNPSLVVAGRAGASPPQKVALTDWKGPVLPGGTVIDRAKTAALRSADHRLVASMKGVNDIQDNGARHLDGTGQIASAMMASCENVNPVGHASNLGAG